MHILKVVSGPGSGQEIEVVTDVVIGREDADLTIPDAEVSRRHAIVRPAGEGIVVEDLGSMNGTIVDGQRISAPVPLTLSAKIGVGPSVVEATLVQQSPTRVSASPSPEPIAAPAATKVRATQPAPAEVPPAAPPGAAGSPPSPPGPARPGSREGPPRKVGLLALGALALVAAIVAGVLLLGGSDSSDETTKRAFKGRAVSAVISPPALKLTAAGQVRAEPIGRAAVLIDRTVPRVPEPGGPAVPLDLRLHFSQPAGSFEAHLTGTVKVSPDGTEIVRGRARTSKGMADYDGVKGSFTLKGDNPPDSSSSVFEIKGTLEY